MCKSLCLLAHVLQHTCPSAVRLLLTSHGHNGRGWMSKRLQAATSSRNERCFEPHKESWVPSEEWIKVGGEEVRECLEHACRTNGYRKDLRGKCVRLYNTTSPPFIPSSPGCWFKYAHHNSSTSADGNTRTWMWFSAKKPLVELLGGNTPLEMPEIPESEMMIVLPTLQTALLKGG
jgi:hypothetical protein